MLLEPELPYPRLPPSVLPEVIVTPPGRGVVEPEGLSVVVVVVAVVPWAAEETTNVMSITHA